MSDRSFGVEFEFTTRNSTGDKKRLVPEIDDWGYSSKSAALRNLLSKEGFGDFSVGADGSEFEVRTPILSGDEGFGRMNDFLSLMDEYGAYCSLNSDGTHVHHDAPEFVRDNKLILHLVEFWIANQEEIHKLVDPCRYLRGSCPTWKPQDFRRLWEQVKTGEFDYVGFGRKNLNIASLRRHGTIELRLHEGTMDYETISSWVKFGQAMIEDVLETAPVRIVPKHSNAEALMKRINVERNASRFLSMKKQRLYGVVSGS